MIKISLTCKIIFLMLSKPQVIFYKKNITFIILGGDSTEKSFFHGATVVVTPNPILS